MLDAISKGIANMCIEMRNFAVATLDTVVSAASNMWLFYSHPHAHCLG